MRRLAVLLAPLFGCYVSHLDLSEEDAARDADGRDAVDGRDAADSSPDDGDGRDAVDGRDAADGPVDALPDGGPACRPAEWVEGDELASYVGETLWVHGFLGPGPFTTCTMGNPDVCLDPGDVCCGTCESPAVLYAARYTSYEAFPLPFDSVSLSWTTSGVPAPPPCAGSLCYRACTPWGRSMEMWVRGIVGAAVPGGPPGASLEVVEPPCVGDGSPAPGTYRIIVRSMDPERCPGAPSLSGTTGTLYLWREEALMAGELWLDAGSGPWPRLLGTWIDDRLVLQDPDRCDPCSCIFDLAAEFPDPGSVTGTVYIEASCACLSAFVFEGAKTSDEVALPGG